MQTKLLLAILTICLASCSTHKQSDSVFEHIEEGGGSEASPNYPYHEDGVICYTLGWYGVIMESGGACIAATVQLALNEFYKQERK